jgi:hypothetical protein
MNDDELISSENNGADASQNVTGKPVCRRKCDDPDARLFSKRVNHFILIPIAPKLQSFFDVLAENLEVIEAGRTCLYLRSLLEDTIQRTNLYQS